MSSSNRSAFTLIELLVVISIISLLIAILLPALSSARENAQALQCKVILRNMSMALYQYQEDNKHLYPPMHDNGFTVPGRFLVWHGHFLKDYFGLELTGPSAGSLRGSAVKCPSDTETIAKLSTYGAQWYGGGAQYNGSSWGGHHMRNEQGNVRVYQVNSDGTLNFDAGIFGNPSLRDTDPDNPYITEGKGQFDGGSLLGTKRIFHRGKMHTISVSLAVKEVDFSNVDPTTLNSRLFLDGSQEWQKVTNSGGNVLDWPYSDTLKVADALAY